MIIILQAYCSGGVCQDLNAMCDATFAPLSMCCRIPYHHYHHVTIHIIDGVTSSVGPQECFNFNTDGTEFGNCGHTSTAFLACDNECVDSATCVFNLCMYYCISDVRCGQLHCLNGGQFRLPVGVRVTTVTWSVFISGQFVRCRYM